MPNLISVNGHWGDWLEWESCNETCGNGFKQRSRKCDSPLPMFGGSECTGLDFDIQNCSENICPGNIRAVRHQTFARSRRKQVLHRISTSRILIRSFETKYNNPAVFG